MELLIAGQTAILSKENALSSGHCCGGVNIEALSDILHLRRAKVQNNKLL